tara:strand:- start:425 stop:613 length:189 start_codon:yes stop_codon:yes gene_type:complete
MLPKYKGFLVLEYRPLVHKDGAPTFIVLVIPPAWLTALILINSPIITKVIPYTKYGIDGFEK